MRQQLRGMGRLSEILLAACLHDVISKVQILQMAGRSGAEVLDQSPEAEKKT